MMAPTGASASGAEAYLPPEGRRSLAQLAKAAESCRGCDLYRDASRVVFGEGAAGAAILLVGEQPGDREDLAGRPFVGPAGRLLDEAMTAASIDRDTVYVTNVVKHFRHTMRGKRRLHQKPSVEHVRACMPWFECEVARVAPRVIVALGATAGQALLGSAYRVTRQRGRLIEDPRWPAPVVGTIHPSAILRIRYAEERAEGLAGLVADLKVAADHAA